MSQRWKKDFRSQPGVIPAPILQILIVMCLEIYKIFKKPNLIFRKVLKLRHLKQNISLRKLQHGTPKKISHVAQHLNPLKNKTGQTIKDYSKQPIIYSAFSKLIPSIERVIVLILLNNLYLFDANIGR